MKNVFALMSGVSLMVSQPLLASDNNEPFRTANRHPLVQIYGLPVAQGAQLTSQAKLNAAFTVEASNTFIATQSGNEQLMIDGESYRSDINWRYGVADGWELALTIPYISHQAGDGDGFIESWHSTFGLPKGDRIDYPEDQLHYYYQQGNQTALNVSDSGDGIGDVSVALGYQLSAATQQQWALRAGYKLATGEVKALRGSDADDAYLSLHVSDQHWAENHHLYLHANVGSLWLGDGEVLAAQQQHQVWFGSATISWAYSDTITFKTQWDMHSAFYDSGLKQLGEPSVQWLLGGSIKIAKNAFLDIAVSEDIVVETAPDVLLHLALRIGEW